MTDLKVDITYEIWHDRKITYFTDTDMISVETDTDNIKDLQNQIKYHYRYILNNTTIHNYKVMIKSIIRNEMCNFTIEQLKIVETFIC
jgi:hypothetical protein